ncbi:MAG: putative lipid II flippase FtsW [Chthoniobacterales bacterium]
MRTFTAILQRHSIHILLLVIAWLVTLGIVMLFSTSAFAQQSHGDTYYFVKRQCFWLGIGFVACTFAALVDYHVWQKWWWVIFAVAAVLLALCFAPHIGLNIKGSRRWLDLRFANFQPSELAKLATIFFLAWWYDRFAPRTREFFFGFICPIAVVSVLLGLIVIEVDIGCCALIGAVMLGMMFVAGASLRYLGTCTVLGLGMIAFIAIKIPERLGRILAFLHPDKYPDEFYQQFQGLIALGSGGVEGLGLGNGRQKMLYLPEAHTDFILPSIGEELGLIFTLLIVGSYLLICICGFLTAMNAKDRFGMLLGFGAISMILVQACVNIGMTTAVLPNKGMPLPFISFGGSNLMICLFMIGLVINIHRHGHPVAAPIGRVRLAARVTPRI